MKESLASLLLLALAASSSVLRGQSTDPRLSTWYLQDSGRYARVYETTADKAAHNAVDTWPRSGLPNQGGGQSTPAYADVQAVSYSTNNVYVDVTGLASYMMGPWLTPTNGVFMFWPTNQAATYRIPRNPTVPTTKSTVPGGPVGIWINGVVIFNTGDAQSYSTSTGQVSFNGQGVWNRLATYGEASSFDAAQAHQPQSGQYHNHTNPLAVRYLLGDHVTYSSATQTYAESAATPAHSPILGWAFDGFPIYGPFGYSSPMDATSGVRRMTSGYIRRDGTYGSTNLNSTGRTTLPSWATAVQSRSAQLPSSEYGPSVSATYPLGTFAEDYDYLGNLGKTQGVDFDLNQQNARYCVTPDYPNGTWAYFISLDSSYNSTFPDVIGYQFVGARNGGTVTSITESVTTYALGGQASPISVTAADVSGSVLLTWASVEGGTYQIATSSDGATYTTLAAGIASAGLTTTYTTSTVASYYKVTLTSLGTYDTGGTGGASGLNTSGSAVTTGLPATPVGSSGTAHLVNIATRAQTGGAAGTPISGFVIGGTGSKTMLIRADGPVLASFGVSGALPDPSLSLVSNGVTIASNDNWDASDASVFASVGAFALSTGSLDAAIVATLSPGTYSAPVGNGGSSGIAMLEVYDADPNNTASTLVNASTSAYVGTGSQVLIPGFVISGTGTVKLLIRAVGPTLASLGVSGGLADPQLTLYQDSTALASNDDWGQASNASDIQAAAVTVGAFALPSGSKDSAILVSLPAGAYSAVVNGAGNTTGMALVEIYVVP